MLTCQIEKMVDALPDLRRILPVQHAETGDRELPCDPQWELYAALERNGSILVTLRDELRFVGYAACFLHPHLNSKRVVVGTISTYWVEQGPKRAFVLRRLLQQALQFLLDRGAEQVFIETEVWNSCGRLLEALGFREAKIGYVLKRSEIGGKSA